MIHDFSPAWIGYNNLLRRMALGLLLVLSFVMFSPGGEAQFVEENAPSQKRAELTDDIAKKLNRLERELRAVQRRVFKDGSVPQSVTEPQSSSESVHSRSLLASLSAQVGSLEAQMRQLTGRLEEIEHEQRELNASLEALRRDTELRLQGVSSLPSVPGPSVSDTGIEPTQSLRSDGVSQPNVPVALPAGSAAEQYDYAFAFVRSGDLDSGRQAMMKFLEAHPADELTPNAIFWLGRIHLRQEKYGFAAQQFLKLIEDHPDHDKRKDALLDLAEALVRLDSASDACDALSEFAAQEGDISYRLQARADRISMEANCPIQ